ncbi:MAG TPA: RimK family alpha-L-glutamate ligase [Patescibacteria group bacterium]|nr:RimK family alpha-L-glutamate ligase [Patescibacteria group bacterium]
MARVGILAATGGWHFTALARAFAANGCETVRLDPERLIGRIGPAGGIAAGAASAARAAGPLVPLEGLDALLVRVIPPGSLDQIVFRVDALHLLADGGLPVVNQPRCLERTIDKHWTSRLLERAGIPTPRTVVAESLDDALQAFATLGDVVVKPLLGSGGRGILRLTDPDLAWRAFRALEEQRAVFYLQEFVPHGRTDLRLFVAGGEVVAAARRSGESWKCNVAAGAATLPHAPTAEQADLAARAAAAVGADYAGVDLLEAEDGRLLVNEVNGIPGWSGLQEVARIDIASVVASRVRARIGGRR